MTKKDYSYLFKDGGPTSTVKGVVHRRPTTRMLLILSSKMIVASLLLLSKTSAVSLSPFDQDNKNKETHVFHEISSTDKNKRQGGQTSNFFDAVALLYNDDSNSEVIKKRTTKDHMIVKQKNVFRQLNNNNEGDKDESLLSTRTFPECIERRLSPKECQTYIQQHIEDAGGHEVGDVNVKIQTPRTPKQLAESYWMVEVPVNLYGKASCDRNNGNTFFPFQWTDGTKTGTTLKVENQDCYGLTAGECCLKIRNYGKQLTKSGYDDNKMCLSCFVHQEPLEPVLNEETSETNYIECKDSTENIHGCVKEQLTGSEVDVLDVQTAKRMKRALSTLKDFQAFPNCSDFDQLLEELYNAAVVIKPLSIKIGRLACVICYGENDLHIYDDRVISLMREIGTMLRHNLPPERYIDSKENCIIIYTNTDGEVVMNPTLGGSRSDVTTNNKEIVSHVAPKDDDDLYGPCYLNPDYCDDTEYCDELGYCFEDICVTNPPDDCNGRYQVCVPDHDSDASYKCLTVPCSENSNADPYYYVTCSEDEQCLYEYRSGTFTCRQGLYKNVGERCGYSEIGIFDEFYDGECDPDVSFCLEPFLCSFTNTTGFEQYYRRCVAYGEGLCITDETTGEVSDVNCKSDEYCSQHSGERCKPNRNIGECCIPELNNCGHGSEFGKLICAPDKKHVDYFGYVLNYYKCQKKCEIDDDCDSDEWCAPVDEFKNDSSPNYQGRFCNHYSFHYCNVKIPSLIDDDLHTEDRCDPSRYYCYDPTFCRTDSETLFESYCLPFGNACTNDSDCANPVMEWCDVDIGYCKERSNLLDCCTTVDEDHKNDCPMDSKCQRYYNGTFYKTGAAICT